MDWNNDGKKDLVVSRFNVNIQIYLNTGTDAAPEFNDPVTRYVKVGTADYNFGDGPLGCQVVDWNKDGKKDVLASGSRNVYILINTNTDANPIFSAPVSAISGSTLIDPNARMVDWDGDGKRDLIVGLLELAGSTYDTGSVYFYPNQGTDSAPSFTDATRVKLTYAGTPLALPKNDEVVPKIVDWDNDGDLDLLLSSDANGLVRLFRNTGASSNRTPVAVEASYTTAMDMAVPITLVGTDADSNALSYAIAVAPSHGVLTGTSSNLTYTPDPGCTGGDRFGFTVSDGTNVSAVAWVNVWMDPYRAAVEPVGVLTNGLTYRKYNGSWTGVPNFGSLTQAVAGVTNTVAAMSGDNYGLRFEGYLNIATQGYYTFYLTSDAGSILYVDGVQAVNHDGVHGATVKTGMVMALRSGYHTVTVDYFETTGAESLQVAYSGLLGTNGALAKTAVPASAYWRLVNQHPVALGQAHSIPCEQPCPVTLAATDFENDAVAYAIVTAPEYGTLSGVPPNVTYTPGPSYIGADSFMFRASDAQGQSAPATVSFLVDKLREPDNPPGVTNGLNYKHYDVTSWGYAMPDYDLMTPMTIGTVTNFTVAPKVKTTWYGFQYRGYVEVPQDAAYTFYLKSDDASMLSIGNSLLIDNDNWNEAGIEKASAPILLKAGKHAISVDFYFCATNYPTTVTDFPQLIEVRYSGGGIAKTLIPDGALYRDPSGYTPFADGQSLTTGEDIPVSMVLTGWDWDLTPVTNFSIVTPPAHGNVTGTGTNRTYTPAPGYAGLDSFCFVATDGVHTSAPAEVRIEIYESRAADTPGAVTNGVDYAYYEGGWTMLPDFDALVPAAVGAVTNFTLSMRQQEDLFATRFHGYLRILQKGAYILTLRADDGGRMRIGNDVVIDFDGLHNPSVVVSTVTYPEKSSDKVFLDAGLHAFTLDYLNYIGDQTLELRIQDVSNGVTTVVAASNLFRCVSNNPPVAQGQNLATPVNTPLAMTLEATDWEGSGLTYTVVQGPQAGSLSGTPPNVTYTPYVGMVGVDSFTFKANDGTSDSAAATVAVTMYGEALQFDNGAATLVTGTSAVLNATFTCSNTFDVIACWGPVSGGMNAGAWSNKAYAGSVTDAVDSNLSYQVTGLALDTTYYATFLATNAGTMIWATPVSEFHTLGAPVVDNGSGAVNLAGAAARLTGRLLLNGPADLYVCWGTLDGGTNMGSWAGVSAPVNLTNGTVQVTVSNLAYLTTYYYRACASNGYGVSWAPAVTNFLTARAPYNTVPYAESFEGLWADNAPVAGTSGWHAVSVYEESIVTNLVNGYTNSVAYPITGYNHTSDNRVVKLDNVGSSALSNAFANAEFTGTNLYVDMMVNLRVAEMLPWALTNDLSVKAAVLLAADGGMTNLHVLHGQKPDSTFGNPVFSAVTNATPVMTGTWYRLTVELASAWQGGVTVEVFKVSLNGQALHSATAGYGSNWATRVFGTPCTPDGGPWFLSAARRAGQADGGANPTRLTALLFTGVGYLDDLVVSRQTPVYELGGLSSYLINQWIGLHGTADNTNSVIEVANGSGLAVTYTADPWFRIASITTNTVAIPGAVNAVSYPVAFSNANDVVVVFTNANGAQVGLPTNVPAGWAAGYYPSESAALSDTNLATDYLLGLDPTNAYEIGFTVKSIQISNSAVTVNVQLKDGTNLITTTLNGLLKLQGKAGLLDADWSDVGGAGTVPDAHFSSGTNTIGVQNPGHNFFRAIITP